MDQLGVGVVCGADQFLVCGSGIVGEELDDPCRIGEVALALDDANRPRAACQQVDAAIVELLDDPFDATGAADVIQTIVGHPDDAELAVVGKAFLDHRLEALLEDVQRHEL